MSIDPNTVRAAADAVQWVDLIAAVVILILSLEAGRRWPKAGRRRSPRSRPGRRVSPSAGRIDERSLFIVVEGR